MNKPSFDTGQREQRHEHQHDDYGGIDDGRAHFQRRGGDHLRHWAWRRGQTVQLEPAQHVFDTDHGIVDQFADGDGQAAEGHGVDRQAEVMEDQRRGQQRHRDRHQRNDGGADIEQEQEQDHRNQDGPVAQRFLDVVHRVLDEVGLLEEEVGRFDPLGQAFAQFCDSLFDFASKGHAVGGGLLLHRQDDCRLASVTAIAALDCRRQPDVGQLLEQDGLTIFNRHHDVLQILDAVNCGRSGESGIRGLGLRENRHWYWRRNP